MSDSTTPAEAIVDDSAAWEALEKEDAGVEVEADAEEAETAPEAEKPEVEAKKDGEKPPLPYEELDKRYKQLQGALGEERMTRKQLAERADQMRQVLERVVYERQNGQQAQQPKPPTIEEDPIGFFQHKLAEQERVIQQLTQGTQQTVEKFQKTQQEQQFWGSVQRSEAEMRASTPDYDPAVEFLETARVRELEVMMPDDSPQAMRLAEQQGYATVSDMRVAALNRDRIAVAQQALQLGVSPAQLYYNLAKQRGYQGQTQPAPGIPKKMTASKMSPVEATKAGLKASRSLSGGGADAGNAMTAEDLADLYLTDPDRADKEFKRLKGMGLLG